MCPCSPPSRDPMPESTKEPQQFGINSWLEEELYQTYLHDRKYVDESWKDVFESNGNVQAGSNGASRRNTGQGAFKRKSERHFQRCRGRDRHGREA